MAAESHHARPTVLTIAGFDPSGGAGMITDIRTLVHFGCRPTAAITSLTFQNSQGVFGAIHESAESLRAQILPIVQENKIGAVKIGMLPSAELAREVSRLIGEGLLPSPVIDPVMQSSSGYRLIDDEAFEVLVTQLIPQSELITPNVPEAEKLAGVNIDDEDTMRLAAARIRELGARAVLVKGGHLGQNSEVRGRTSENERSGIANEERARREAVDLLDDEGSVEMFRGDWIDAPPVRGTGCMLSSAIAACLAKGKSLTESVSAAKKFVAAEILNSKLKTEN